MASQQMKILLEVQDKATKALKNSQKQFKKLASVAGKAGKSIGKAMMAVGKSVFSLKTALIGVAGAVGFGLVIKSSLKAIDSLGKVSKKLGIGSDDLQRFRLASELAGIEQTALDMGLQRFTRRAGEAVQGLGEAKGALEKMNVQLVGSDGNLRSTRDLLGDVAEAFLHTEDPAERLRLAFKLFDSEGVAMVNVLSQGRDGLNKMLNEADKLGIILSTETVESAEKVNDQFTRLGATFLGFRDKLAGSLAPALEKFASWWTEFMMAFNTSIKPIFPFIIEQLEKLKGGFGNATEAGEKWGKRIGFYIQELTKAFVKFFETGEDGTNGFDRLIDKIKEMYEMAKPVFRDLITIIKAVANAVKSISSAITSAINGLKSLGANVADMTGAGMEGSMRVEGTKASGGGVRAGGSYLVGERGAEVFTPTTSGTVSASSKGSTSITNIYTNASAHGIDTALASRGDSISRGSRVGLAISSVSSIGYINLSGMRVR